MGKFSWFYNTILTPVFGKINPFAKTDEKKKAGGWGTKVKDESVSTESSKDPRRVAATKAGGWGTKVQGESVSTEASKDPKPVAATESENKKQWFEHLRHKISRLIVYEESVT